MELTTLFGTLGTLGTLAIALPLTTQAATFTLESPDVGPGAPIANTFVFRGFGCEGDNLSPALAWQNAPAGTRSFALTVYDPDAPTGSGFWHWVVTNLPATTTSLPRGAGSADGSRLPQGTVQFRTDFGTPGYGGPCPPVGHGDHRYIFTIHALKVDRLDVPADATAAMVGFNLHFNTLAKASFTARYGRK
ncbi:MAG: YbhB/YbcL family Raf kinase inhibitor-like protein [Proteobacteria bacterium]|nr:YbhB/YbcL family Raf kinase inhibitor-like protein [Pseudomonadota bacterium]HQR04445.1 YbhB/YbcL family Raf kinase inhibitor-like protein [Rhodocyclaceae bacterium]